MASGKILEVKEQLDKSLHDPAKPWTHFLASLEAKTGLNRLYIFVGTYFLNCHKYFSFK